MYMVGPEVLRIVFRVFVVIVGFLILSGAINTSIIGSTGVLMRVAEDGVLTDWFRRPHRKVWHELPHREPGGGLPALHHHREPRAMLSPWARPMPLA